ncbi:efflux RND transporter periplasmic adaptor subunit [Phycisphaerales bacterium AB-hyl4]|uniref:Efflux RND transporter periplasmic adaptor subunit n=1 Tax=Natronomicrosphaera hydrolytica TaxID=3242702 RepID=A0ABV4U4L1_9BACT
MAAEGEGKQGRRRWWSARPWVVTVVSLAVAVVLLAVVVVVILISTGAGDEAAAAPVRAMSVRVVAVEAAEGYEVVRQFVGQVEPARQSAVGFELSGMMAELLVDEGDTVERGQVLARLDTARLEARRHELEASLREARARTELAEQTYERTTEAAEHDAVSSREVDEARSELATAEAAEARAEASLTTLEVDLRKSELVSPFDAVVARRMVDEGQVASEGAAVFELLDRHWPRVRVGLAGDAVRRYAAGDVVSVQVNGETVAAEVRSLLPVRERATRMVDVLLVLDGELNDLRRGDTAVLSVERQVAGAGYWLPLSALTEGARGLWACYVVETDGGAARVSRRDVELLYQDGERAFVRGALAEGQRVVADGLHRLTPGQVVRVADEP